MSKGTKIRYQTYKSAHGKRYPGEIMRAIVLANNGDGTLRVKSGYSQITIKVDDVVGILSENQGVISFSGNDIFRKRRPSIKIEYFED